MCSCQNQSCYDKKVIATLYSLSDFIKKEKKTLFKLSGLGIDNKIQIIWCVQNEYLQFKTSIISTYSYSQENSYCYIPNYKSLPEWIKFKYSITWSVIKVTI